PESKNYLPLVRQALFNKDYDKATELVKHMQGLYSESYLPLADLTIEQDFGAKQPTAYNRTLDIEDAISSTTFTIDGIQYKREIFASAPAQVIVMKISSNKANKISLTLKASSQIHFHNMVLGNDLLALKGKAPAHADPSYFNEGKDAIIYKDTNN